MPTITVKVTEQEKADVQARAGGAGISALVRRALDLERDGPDLQARLADHETRLARLEQIARDRMTVTHSIPSNALPCPSCQGTGRLMFAAIREPTGLSPCCRIANTGGGWWPNETWAAGGRNRVLVNDPCPWCRGRGLVTAKGAPLEGQ